MAEKSLKETKVVKVVKAVVGAAAAIGGSALAGAALKNVDSKTIKGIGKICLPIGVVGLSHIAGNLAKQGIQESIDDTIDVVEYVVDTSDIVDALEPAEDFDDDIEIVEDVE